MRELQQRTRTRGDKTASSKKQANLGRHEHGCKVCSHKQREAIERDFLNWRSPALIAKEYGLKDRSSVYRHAYALNLLPKRQRNVRAALEHIIEGAGQVEVTAAAVVAAVRAYASINSFGQWVERSEQVNLNELFERMTRQELDAYARDGTLPEWFTRTVTATTPYSQEPEDDA